MLFGPYSEVYWSTPASWPLVVRSPVTGQEDLDWKVLVAEAAWASRAVGECLGEIKEREMLGAGLGVELVVGRASLPGFADIEVHGGFAMDVPIDVSFAMLVDSLDVALAAPGRQQVDAAYQ